MAQRIIHAKKKPAQRRAEEERCAAIRLRRYARSIPDNATLINLLGRWDAVFRAEFYRRVARHLKFQPVPLETINELLRSEDEFGRPNSGNIEAADTAESV